MIVIISGFIDIDPAQREQALNGAEPYIRGALTQPGCVNYAWMRDPLTAGRIVVFEEWESQESLAAHLAGPHYHAMLGHLQEFNIRAAIVRKHRVDLSEPVYDRTGKPRADFFTAKS